MSTVCRFSPTAVKEFLHKCQPGVGRCSKQTSAGGRGRFWQISKPFLNQEGQFMPTTLLLAPSDFQTFLWHWIKDSEQNIVLKYLFTYLDFMKSWHWRKWTITPEQKKLLILSLQNITSMLERYRISTLIRQIRQRRNKEYDGGVVHFWEKWLAVQRGENVSSLQFYFRKYTSLFARTE